jgi:hypothetical protein
VRTFEIVDSFIVDQQVGGKELPAEAPDAHGQGGDWL